MLKNIINERKTNLQSRKGEGHAYVGASSEDCKIQNNLLV
jgi:hypothetical protein